MKDSPLKNGLSFTYCGMICLYIRINELPNLLINIYCLQIKEKNITQKQVCPVTDNKYKRAFGKPKRSNYSAFYSVV